MKLTTWKRVVPCLALCAIAAAVLSARGEGQPPRSRAEFMRKKLEYSKSVLEGLTLENYEAIARNAKALQRLSQSAEWDVPTIPNAPDYVAYTGEFQSLTEELARKAKEKNIDGATLAYLRLTMNCVNCHKYVRHVSR